MMFLTVARKRILFCFTYKVLISMVLASNDMKAGDVSNPIANRINTDKQFIFSSFSTDTEVLDLTNIHHHVKTTSPMTVVMDVTSKNESENTDLNFNIDDITNSGRNLETNGRYNPTSGAVAVVTCLSLALVAFIGILFWRNVIQKNHETREILLNEDDIGDINDEDMRHFEAACIEIET